MNVFYHYCYNKIYEKLMFLNVIIVLLKLCV